MPALVRSSSTSYWSGLRCEGNERMNHDARTTRTSLATMSLVLALVWGAAGCGGSGSSGFDAVSSASSAIAQAIDGEECVDFEGQTFCASGVEAETPEFEPGDSVRVHFKVIEGSRQRVQVFEGTVAGYFMAMQKLERAEAEVAAKEHLAKMPAWVGR